MWPLNPTSRKVARALVAAARVLDADPTAHYPYGGPVRRVHTDLLRLLGDLGPTPNPLARIRAARLCRAVENGTTITSAEMERLTNTINEGNPE
jgi:hypothetical protein